MLGIRGVSPPHVARTGRRDRAERGDWLFRALQFRQLIVKPRARVTDLVAHVVDGLWQLAMAGRQAPMRVGIDSHRTTVESAPLRRGMLCHLTVVIVDSSIMIGIRPDLPSSDKSFGVIKHTAA